MPAYTYKQYPYVNLKDTDIIVDNDQYEVKIEQIEIVRNELYVSGAFYDKLGKISKKFSDKILLE